MQNSPHPKSSPKTSHFEQIDIALLRTQNHNLFQTVNQLRHRLAQLTSSASNTASQVDRGFIHRILKFVLVCLVKPTGYSAHQSKPVSSRREQEIEKIVSEVLDYKSRTEKEIHERLHCFVEGSVRIVNGIFGGEVKHKQELNSKA